MYFYRRYKVIWLKQLLKDTLPFKLITPAPVSPNVDTLKMWLEAKSCLFYLLTSSGEKIYVKMEMSLVGKWLKVFCFSHLKLNVQFIGANSSSPLNNFFYFSNFTAFTHTYLSPLLAWLKTIINTQAHSFISSILIYQCLHRVCYRGMLVWCFSKM